MNFPIIMKLQQNNNTCMQYYSLVTQRIPNPQSRDIFQLTIKQSTKLNERIQLLTGKCIPTYNHTYLNKKLNGKYIRSQVILYLNIHNGQVRKIL